MSGIGSASIGSPNVTTGAPTTVTDQVIAQAKDLPDLIQKASTFDPALAAKFTGQALLASRSPWGTLAGGIVAWLVSHYSLGWDDATCSMVAGAGVLVGAYVMRWVTKHPITGILRAATPAETIEKVETATPSKGTTP